MKKENPTFVSWPKETSGLIFSDRNHEKYPINFYNELPGVREFDKNRSYYMYCYEGSDRSVLSILDAKGDPAAEYILRKGQYASFSTNSRHTAKLKANGNFIIIEVLHTLGAYPETNFRAVTQSGGPIEKKGRLKYIDGCTDSLLIPPVKMGDPCLNHLHFPRDIDQTAHTHPSHRIGIVADGEGECITPFGNLPLTKGMIFVIKEYDGVEKAEGLDGKMYPAGTHAFRTTDNTMDVIAFHPDSDFGPTDVDHPMINRTIVDGVSANSIDDIRTK